jgi:hypothetical protein
MVSFAPNARVDARAVIPPAMRKLRRFRMGGIFQHSISFDRCPQEEYLALMSVGKVTILNVEELFEPGDGDCRLTS